MHMHISSELLIHRPAVPLLPVSIEEGVKNSARFLLPSLSSPLSQRKHFHGARRGREIIYTIQTLFSWQICWVSTAENGKVHQLCPLSIDWLAGKREKRVEKSRSEMAWTLWGREVSFIHLWIHGSSSRSSKFRTKPLSGFGN